MTLVLVIAVFAGAYGIVAAVAYLTGRMDRPGHRSVFQRLDDHFYRLYQKGRGQ